MAASTPRPRAQELQARTTAEVDKGSSSGGQTSGGARLQASWFRPLHLLLVFVCLSPVTFSIPKVEAGTSPVDSLLQDFTAVLERAQRLEQSGVPAFQQIQRHLDAFISQMEEAQKSLWESVASDDARGLEAAVRRGAVIERRNPDKMSPLALASKEGRVEAVWALLRLGADANATAGEKEWTPLLWARVYKQIKCETLLLAVGAHVGVARAEAQRQLWEGVNEDDVLKIEEAVLSGADLEEVRNSDKKTPLTEAAWNGRVGAVRALLRHGAGLEGRDGEVQATALHWASTGGQDAVVRELLAAGASVGAETKDRSTPLHWASEWGHEAVVRELLAAGASVGAQGSNRWTPLHSASYKGRVAVVRELLAAGASVKAEASDGWTPLHWASHLGHVAVVRELLEAGASVGAEASDRTTPLYWASHSGHVAVVRALLAAGASARAVDSNKWTPLHGASAEGHLTIARLLVEAGADLKVRNNGGNTPLGLAVRRGHNAVAEYLRSVGATR